MLDGQAGERELSGCVFSNYLWVSKLKCAAVCARARGCIGLQSLVSTRNRAIWSG